MPFRANLTQLGTTEYGLKLQHELFDFDGSEAHRELGTHERRAYSLKEGKSSTNHDSYQLAQLTVSR